MKWRLPWRSRSKHQTNSKQAKVEALNELRTAKDRWPEIRRVTDDLRKTRERNGFGESMMQLFREVR